MKIKHNYFITHSKAGTFGQTNSLKSIRLSSYQHINDFNIPKAISGLGNLRSLWIEAPVAPHISSSSQTVNKVSTAAVFATDLRKEMLGYLPSKLRQITIGGKGYTILSDLLLSVRNEE